MPRLRIQAILYQHATPVVDRLLRSVLATVRHAQRLDTVQSATIALGDSSAQPVVGKDQYQRWAKKLFAAGIELRVVHFGANLGHSGGQNALARDALSASDLLLLLNPDGIAATSMLARLVRGLGPGVAAAEARQSPFEHPKAYDPRTGDTAWVAGAATLLRAEAFAAVNGFDADTFFLHGDDVDLSWRLRLAGWRLRHVPEAVFVHDKRLDGQGNVRTPATEQFHASLGALLLLHKYSRPEALNHWEEHLLAHGTAEQRNALTAFRGRRAAGELPEPIDPRHEVSEVIGASFGPYRF